MESSICYYSLPLGLGLFGVTMFFLLQQSWKKGTTRWERELRQLSIKKLSN